MSDISAAEEAINEKNNETYIKFVDRYWGLESKSLDFIRNRLVTKDFDHEFAKYLKDTPDQRIRWDIDFTEPAMREYYQSRDEAYKMFLRKFRYILSFIRSDFEINIEYKEFMENKVTYKKNETKIKKIFELAYAKSRNDFCKDAEVNSSTTVDEETISKFIVKSFEQIGSLKKPCKKLQLVLSLNLVDWLLASTGGSISSCLNMEGGGHRFWTGLPLLSGDANRAMLYVSDGSKKEFEGMVVDSCSTRSWVILTKNNKKAIIRWYSSEVLTLDAIKNISGDMSFTKGMETNGKNEIFPIKLASGITSTIFMDEGSWTKNGEKFIHSKGSKGGFQVFGEDLTIANGFEFIKPWQTGSDSNWRISDFKRLGYSINDYVPLAFCSKCGAKKNPVKNSNLRAPVCLSCFNQEFFSCTKCGKIEDKTKNHFEGEVVDGRELSFKKLCSNCSSAIKKCECCGKLAIDGKNTLEKGYVCLNCLEEPTNGYKTCSTCGEVSKVKIKKVYIEAKKCFQEFCDKHVVVTNDIEANKTSFIPYIRAPMKPVSGCSRCKSLVPPKALVKGVCLSCRDS